MVALWLGEGSMVRYATRNAMMDVALGTAPADLVLTDATLINVLTREI